MSQPKDDHLIVETDLMHRIDGLLTLIYYREGTALTPQTYDDLGGLIAEVHTYTRQRP